MLSTTFPPWPDYSPDEIEAVTTVLGSRRVNYWTGDQGHEFERELAAWTNVERSIAVANGTVALDLALKALGIGSGDEVVVTPRTFIASVSCVVNAGSKPVFADVDEDSGNITAASIERVISSRTKAVICVHLAGWPCEMEPITSLAKQHGLFVDEDCAQAHGASYKGRPIGSIGDVGAWSFCQDKIMSTGGEGGMVTTNNRSLWSRMWSYKDHGKSWEAVNRRDHSPGFRWLHESFGTNWRMTEIQAAIGRLQLRKMPEWHGARKINAAILEECFRNISGLRVAVPPADIEHAYYKYYVYVRPSTLKSSWSRDRVIAEINANGIPCYSGTCSEVYLEKAFEGTEMRPNSRLPVAQALGESSLMFLVHPTLGAEHMEQTSNVVRKVMNKALR